MLAKNYKNSWISDKMIFSIFWGFFFGHFRFEFQTLLLGIHRYCCLGPESEIKCLLYAIEKNTKILENAWFFAFLRIFLGHFRFEFKNFVFSVSSTREVWPIEKISAKLNSHKWNESFRKSEPLEKRLFGLGTGSTPKYFLISAKMGYVSPY